MNGTSGRRHATARHRKGTPAMVEVVNSRPRHAKKFVSATHRYTEKMR